MKSEFIEKKIYVLGDSITQHGHYLYHLRSYFHAKKDKCYFFNRGIGGNTAFMAKEILAWEIGEEKPDYVFVNFGVNDMYIWLYNYTKEETPELIAQRKKQDDEYFDGMDAIVTWLQDKGIQPVIVTPIALNEYIDEHMKIETLGDSEAKRQYIQNSLYTTKSFKKINEHSKYYAEKMRVYAEEKGIMFLNLFEDTYASMQKKKGEGFFNADGIHRTLKGHADIARSYLKFLGCEDIPKEFERSAENDAIFDLEQIERSTVYLPCNECNPALGEYKLADMENHAKKLLADKETPNWLAFSATCFLEKRNEVAQMRKNLEQLTFQF